MNTIPAGQPNTLVIELKNVSKVYGTGPAATHALRGIDLGISPGEFVAVMGPSGSGKSTCMNILGCLDTPTSGTYVFQGLDVGTLSRNQRALLRRHALGFVFQGFNLLNRTSALENVELPLLYRGASGGERRAQARQTLAAVGLTGWESHTPGELSGGQQQRVAIARAIVCNPAVLFADEPTGNLDSAMSLEIMALLTALNDERGITVIMVTHEREMARFARRIVYFRDGRIDSDGLARIIHEERVNIPGLPEQHRFPLAAGGCVAMSGPDTRPASRGRGAVSRCTGDA